VIRSLRGGAARRTNLMSGGAQLGAVRGGRKAQVGDAGILDESSTNLEEQVVGACFVMS
jgi:hypothetical protein